VIVNENFRIILEMDLSIVISPSTITESYGIILSISPVFPIFVPLLNVHPNPGVQSTDTLNEKQQLK